MMRSMIKIKFLRLCILSAFCTVFALFGTHAQAGTFAADACDPLYYESLESRAWLEAQREITQNQNLIFKSDSVLEYTCFDGYLRELADHSTDMFSGSGRWGGSGGTMAASLSNLVAAPMDAYQRANFDHRLLGGRSNLTHDLPSSIGAGTYTCNRMNEVWKVAKCMDFIDQTNYPEGAASANDGFFTFAEYAANPDKRFLPTACTKTADFQTEINEAVVAANTPWEEDNVNTYSGLIYPTTGSACGGTQSIIPTGLTIYRAKGGSTQYHEHVCVVPGCHYVPNNQPPPTGPPVPGTPPPGRCCLFNDTSGACNP